MERKDPTPEEVRIELSDMEADLLFDDQSILEIENLKSLESTNAECNCTGDCN